MFCLQLRTKIENTQINVLSTVPLPGHVPPSLLSSKQAGTLELDYVATTRRTPKSGRVGGSQQGVMSVRRFQDLLHQLGLSDGVEWADGTEEEFDRAIDEALQEVGLTGWRSVVPRKHQSCIANAENLTYRRLTPAPKRIYWWVF